MTEISLMENLSGQSFGRYELRAPLGEGGMASVYRAYQADIDREVAIKVLPPQFASDEQFVRRFQLEAQTLARLQHPHIVPIYDFGRSNRYLYLVMPYVAGGDLGDQMGKVPLDLPGIARTFMEIATALDHAHQRGIIHRDIKPGNILLNRQGHAMLSDFGLAKMVSGQQNLTDSNMVLGSAEYMSPEQGLGRSIDPRTDIYSLGIVLYEFLTGRTPYKADTWSATIMRAISEPMLPPSQLNQAINAAMEAVIYKACDKEPQNRYATATDMIVEFQDAIIGQAISAETTKQAVSAISQWRQAADSNATTGTGDMRASSVSEPAPFPSRQTDAGSVPRPSMTKAPQQSVRTPRQLNGPLKIGLGILGIAVISALIMAIFLTIQSLGGSDEPVVAAPPDAAPSMTEASGADLQTSDPNAGDTDPVEIPTLYPEDVSEDVAPPPPTAGQLPLTDQSDDEPGDSRDGPPIPAINACVGKTLGDACSFVLPDNELGIGFCIETQTDLACRPENRPPNNNSPDTP